MFSILWLHKYWGKFKLSISNFLFFSFDDTEEFFSHKQVHFPSTFPSKLKTFEKDQGKNEDDPSYLNKKFLCQPKTKTEKIGMHV